MFASLAMPANGSSGAARNCAYCRGAGQIRGLKWQVRFELIPKQSGERACHYVADFVYEENGVRVVEDCKGMRTPLYVVKRKLMLFVHGIKIRET